MRNGYSYSITGIGSPLNSQRFSVLQHHIVCIQRTHPQSAEIAGNTFIYGLSQYFSSFYIGMNSIRQHKRIRVQRCMEINQLNTGIFSNILDSQLYFIMPITCTRLKTGMAIGNRGKTRNQDTASGISHTKRIYQRPIILNKEITIIRPIPRICIVNTQMDNNDITGKINSFMIFLLLHIRAMTFVQQSSTGLSKVTNHIIIPQHFL